MGTNSSSMESDEVDLTTNDTETELSCDAADKAIDIVFKAYLLLSVLAAFGLSFVVRRRTLCPTCCWKRPGFLQPLNFMDEIGRRWAYAACFVIVSNDILHLFIGESHLELMPTEDEEWMRKYGWVGVFNKLFEALCICVVFYPLLACIDHRHSIAANIVGILCLTPWIEIYTEFFCYCPMEKGFLGTSVQLRKIPIYIAMYVVGASYVLDLVRNCIRIRKRCRKAADKTMAAIDNVEKRDYKIAHHLKYVVALLNNKGQEQTDEIKSTLKVKSKKLIKQVKYKKILGFCYSTRIVCCITVSATFVFWIMIYAARLFEILTQLMILGCNAVEDSLFHQIFEMFCEYVSITRILLHVANVIAGVVIIGFLFNTLISYKQRWHQLLRGDHSWHMYGAKIVHPQNTLMNGLKFAGYQAAYVAWGWIVLMLVLSLLFMFLTFGLIIPLKNGESNWLIRMISKLWPTILLGFIIALIQKVICRFCFLQEKGSVMALTNRRAYNAVSYYFLILNVIVGFFSCMKRILIPFVLGVAFLSRLDRPLIMSGFESHDPGFASFVSMLLVDLYHNHPVVKTFVELMLKVREQREQQEQQSLEQQKQPLTGKGDEDAAHEVEKRLRSKMIRNRWLKTLTLVNNPSLVVKILEQRLIDERKDAVLPAVLPVKSEDGSCAIEMRPLYDNTAEASKL